MPSAHRMSFCRGGFCMDLIRSIQTSPWFKNWKKKKLLWEYCSATLEARPGMHSQIHILPMSHTCAGVKLSRFQPLSQLALHGQQEPKGCAPAWVCPCASWSPRLLAHQALWQVESHTQSKLPRKGIGVPDGRGKPLLWEPPLGRGMPKAKGLQSAHGTELYPLRHQV